MNPILFPFAVAGGVLLALMAGCVLVACLFLRRKRRKQLADQLSCKLREEALDRALANPLAPTGRSVLDPVQVEYSMKADRQGGGALLRLTEHNLTVTRVYLFDLDQRLFLGVQDNQTVLRRDYVPDAGILCEICQNHNALCARGLAAGATLQGGTAVTALGKNGVALRTGDELLLPGTQFRVELI